MHISIDAQKTQYWQRLVIQRGIRKVLTEALGQDAFTVNYEQTEGDQPKPAFLKEHLKQMDTLP